MTQAQDQVPAAPEQPSDQTTGQPSAADVVPETSAPPSAAPSDDPSVSVLLRNFTHLTGGDPDINKVIHLANRAQELERGGYGTLADRAGEIGEGVDGHFLVNQLLNPVEQPEVPGQTYQEPPPQQGFPGQGQDVNTLVDQRIEERMSQWSAEQNMAQGRQTEQDAYGTELSRIGFQRNPKPMDTGSGAVKEIDPIFDNFLMPAMARKVSELMASQVSPTDPNYHQKISAPASPEIVKQAADWLAPHLKTYSQQSAETLAASQSHIPPEGLTGAGPSGRAQTNVSEMSADERKRHVMAKAKASGNWTPTEG